METVSSFRVAKYLLIALDAGRSVNRSFSMNRPLRSTHQGKPLLRRTAKL
jgi:hypothetical protein